MTRPFAVLLLALSLVLGCASQPGPPLSDEEANDSETVYDVYVVRAGAEEDADALSRPYLYVEVIIADQFDICDVTDWDLGRTTTVDDDSSPLWNEEVLSQVDLGRNVKVLIFEEDVTLNDPIAGCQPRLVRGINRFSCEGLDLEFAVEVADDDTVPLAEFSLVERTAFWLGCSE